MIKNLRKEISYLLVPSLLAIFIGYFISITSNYFFDLRYFLLVVIFLLISIPIVISITKKEFDILEIINLFLFLYFMAFFVKPILILIDEDFVVLKHLYSGGKYFDLSLLAAIIGLLAFYSGYYSFKRERTKGYFNKGNIYKSSRAIVVVFMCIIGGIGGYLCLVYSSGGLTNFITSAFIGRGELFVGKGYILIISFFCWLAVATCISYIYHKGGIFYKSLLFYMMFFTILLIQSSYASRTALLSIILIPIIYFHFRYRKIRLKKSLISIIILFTLLTTYDVYRQTEIGISKYGGGTLKDIIKTSIGSSFAEIDGFSIILEQIPLQRDFFYGQVELEALIYPLIPRAIFPSKKIIWGTNLIQEVYIPNYQFTTYSVSILGPGYADFGWFGIIMNMFLLGFISKYLFQKFKQDPDNDGNLFLYIFFICNIVNIVRDGITVFLSQIPYLLAMLLIFRYIQISRSIYPVKLGTTR